MGYYTTSLPEGKCTSPSKNRVGRFLSDGKNRVGENTEFAQCLHRENRLATTKHAPVHLRFSTKPLDEESKLYYYGFRYLDTETGRWLSRDPIQESGGFNLNQFLNNDPVNAVDLLGAVKCTFIFAVDHNYENNGIKDYVEEVSGGCSSGTAGAGCGAVYMGSEGGIHGIEHPLLYLGIGKKSQKYYERSNGGRNPASHKNNRFVGVALGYASYIQEQWSRTIEDARSTAEDCQCDCDKISVIFNCPSSASKSLHRKALLRATNNGFQNKLIELSDSMPRSSLSVPSCGTKIVLECKKNKKAK